MMMKIIIIILYVNSFSSTGIYKYNLVNLVDELN